MVPRVGVEPTRPYGQRILRTLERVPRSLTKRYEPVFTRLAVVKVSLGLATLSIRKAPSWPQLFFLIQMKPQRFAYRRPLASQVGNTGSIPVARSILLSSFS